MDIIKKIRNEHNFIDIETELLTHVKILHGDQIRINKNEPYVVHPTRVASIVKHFTNDLNLTIAAMFHDIFEDVDEYKKKGVIN